MTGNDMTRNNYSKLYSELLRISENYFGPATERVLAAQLLHHLHKTPDRFTKADIPELLDWLGLSLAVISNDEIKIKEYLELIKKLGGDR